MYDLRSTLWYSIDLKCKRRTFKIIMKLINSFSDKLSQTFTFHLPKNFFTYYINYFRMYITRVMQSL
jgi:hypothetical protein